MTERGGSSSKKGKGSEGGRGGKPISLHPLSLEEALAGLLSVPPPEKEPTKKEAQAKRKKKAVQHRAVTRAKKK
jgi:hypothetical protein